MSRVLLLLSLLLLLSCSNKTPRVWHHSLKEIGAKEGDEVYIRIFKMEHILELWVKSGERFKLYREYPILKESGRIGPKIREGDYQNPEGVYKVYKSSLNPNSKYHLAIDIGYPNRYDKALGRTGSAIMIHGSNRSIGCFAMGDEGIEEIYNLVEKALNNGQKFIYVTIFPFKINDENMQKYSHNKKFMRFWKQMENIYYIFENEKIPPKVIVLDKSYLVAK